MLLLSPISYGRDVTVDCGKENQSIGAALAKLPAQGPHTIWVSGECHESVVIERRDDLTIVGVDGASIHDPTPENLHDNYVVYFFESTRIRLENFKIFGGINGVVCTFFSSCDLKDLEVTGASAEGIAFSRSGGSIEGNTVISDNGSGMTLYSQSIVNMYNVQGRVSIHDNLNWGLRLQDNSVLLLTSADVTDNGGTGIFADLGAEFRLNNVSVTGNTGDGVWLRSGIGQFAGVTIASNYGDGVRVGQLSFARFIGSTVKDNSSGTDINCASGTAATIGAIQAVGDVDGTTNCTDAP
jgi:hypothetical protein